MAWVAWARSAESRRAVDLERGAVDGAHVGSGLERLDIALGSLVRAVGRAIAHAHIDVPADVLRPDLVGGSKQEVSRGKI